MVLGQERTCRRSRSSSPHDPPTVCSASCFVTCSSAEASFLRSRNTSLSTPLSSSLALAQKIQDGFGVQLGRLPCAFSGRAVGLLCPQPQRLKRCFKPSSPSEQSPSACRSGTPLGSPHTVQADLRSRFRFVGPSLVRTLKSTPPPPQPTESEEDVKGERAEVDPLHHHIFIRLPGEFAFAQQEGSLANPLNRPQTLQCTLSSLRRLRTG